MVSVTHAAHNIEITAESLQEDLARLQAQKQALERELAAVVAHLGSVQRALSALETLMLNPVAAASTGTAGAAGAERGQVATPIEPQTDSASSGLANVTTKSALRAQKMESGKDAVRPAAAGTDSDGHKKYGQLTEQIMEYFAEVGDADVRARDVAAALGRDSDSGSINGVRSTLDRLVGASRVQRIGRGLYRAKRS
ncbi:MULTISPECIES: hypothetical protein [unclassified Streptomyces]|uniref:hypothetical protein n=1 Tax=unclassified Streptomyces TaxID=2593676 RepID=UPI002DDC5C8A|nr:MULTISPECIES: hypothetical protein [unclassified Streptomyces]WSC41594.1 hypothetical protein OHA08_42665 [Streptomyces sp. NBC_01763]WSC51258.1 hypothetical protein OG808_02290 [Streptomyces sp. NBC_01761]